MKNKWLLGLLVPLMGLTASCGCNPIPSDLDEYIYDFSIETAITNVHKCEYKSSTIVSIKEDLKHDYSYENLYFDITDDDNYYLERLITNKPEGQFVTEEKINDKYLKYFKNTKEDEFYNLDSSINGKKETKQVSKEEVTSALNECFYKQNIEGYYLNGLYFGDEVLRTIRRQTDLYSIDSETGLLKYHKPYSKYKEDIYYEITYFVNHLGMITKYHLEGFDETTYSFTMDIEVTYNDNATYDPLDYVKKD